VGAGERCDRASLAAVYREGAAGYDTRWSPVILPPAEAVVAALELAGASVVLDVGAGTGALTPALRVAAPRAAIVSIDPSQDMLEYARARRGVLPILGDAAALPHPDGCADAVMLAYVLFHLLDPEAGVREALRVLRPGSRLGTVTWQREWAPAADEVWTRGIEELEVPDFPAHSSHTGLDSVEAIERLLLAAGARSRRVWVETVEHVYTEANYFDMRTTHGRNRARLALLDDDRRTRVLADLRRRLEGLGPSDYVFKGELVCSVSEKPT